ncbi:myosin heavy chain kinase B-like [Dendronephthya gigantea]|uniref:myosin heavy chain kinase B-like n=1 Tax=Dendronephthya gigantea TaxID=151771 RepID=UPI00106C9240|nr:myosin heavy chain kinase B-like [Dendronephthya gigantea]
MHCAARHLTKVFSTKAPKEFGQCFTFNYAYYTVYQGQPATVEEFVEGTFRKYINNNGKVCKQPESGGADMTTIFEKAECLVHFSYVQTSEKLMLLDLQGAKYYLYDPEIATTELHSQNDEVYFCCGNLSTVSISQFNGNHTCNKFCEIMGLKRNTFLVNST